AVVRYQYGLVLLSQKYVREAIGQLRLAAREQVRSAAVHQALGVAFAFSNDLRRAARSFKAALTLQPGMLPAFHGLAEVLLQQGKLESASRLLDDHVKSWPKDYTAREILGRVHLKQ